MPILSEYKLLFLVLAFSVVKQSQNKKANIIIRVSKLFWPQSGFTLHDLLTVAVHCDL